MEQKNYDSKTCEPKYPWTKHLPVVMHIDTAPNLVTTNFPDEANLECLCPEERISVADLITHNDNEVFPSSNEDLDNFLQSLLGMQQFVEDLQLEVLKLRHEAEVKTWREKQTNSEYSDLLEGLGKLSTTFELHKTDYSIVTETQAENVELREKIFQLTDQLHCANLAMEKLKTETEIELKNLKENHSQELTEQRERFVKERLVEKEAWEEEKANLLVKQANELAVNMKKQDEMFPDFRSEIYRQINNEQNLATAKVVQQLQARIDEMVGTPTTSYNPSGNSPLVTNQRHWSSRQTRLPVLTSLPNANVAPLVNTPRSQCFSKPDNQLKSDKLESVSYGYCGSPKAFDLPPSTLPMPQKKARVTGVCQQDQKKMPNSTTKLATSHRIAAVPPVLVVSNNQHHPLLNSTDSCLNEGFEEEYVHLSDAQWQNSSSTINKNKIPSASDDFLNYFQMGVDFTSPEDWFPYSQDLTQAEEFPGDDEYVMNRKDEMSQARVCKISPLFENSQIRPQSGKRQIFTFQSGHT